MLTAIDLFAGAGGFSTGAAAAGCNVLWAANHWPTAVQWHTANHPGTIHACQDLHQADFRDAPAHDLLLASPACQGHSLARGKDKPHHDAQRATAWAVITCAEVHRPAAVLVENVPEFTRWVLYPAWCAAMHALGYALQPMTGVRVERLQDISRGDAMAEGCPFANMAAGPDPRDWYRDLWNEINGAGAWDLNPWVWVVKFKAASPQHGEAK